VRADARRNRELLLEAARETFAAEGVEASLDRVARRAGVGSGTLYRHFPTRDSLVLALMREGLEDLCRLGPELAAAHPPGVALDRWLAAYAAHGAGFRGLAATLVTTDLADDDPSVIDCHRAHAAGQALVEAAVAAGAVRPDVDPQDVLDLAAATAWIEEQGPRGEDHRDRLLAVILAGIAAPVPESVTG
jgi:AcrR family transcriptional regulator